MKKFAIFAALLLLCAASGYAQDKKVAVVTFFINKQIDVTEFGAGAYAAVTKLNDDPNFNLGPLLKDFHTRFFDSYSKDFPFQLAPEDQVTTNPDYKAFVPAGSDGSGVLKISNYTIPYDGYKVVLPVTSHKNEKDLVKIFSEFDGLMYVAIDFKLVKIGFGGMGVVKVEAIANIILFNKNGDKVFSVQDDAKSKEVSPLVGGVPAMSVEKIMPMCSSALDELMTALEKDMPKMVKKAGSKL
jgi:hypothetical protein